MKRIVIADDRTSVLEILEDFSRLHNISIIGLATTAEEVLDKVRTNQPDGVILDLRMPPSSKGLARVKVTGTSLIGQIREACPETKIAVFTAGTDLLDDARLAGADALFMKDQAEPMFEWLDANL
jgi:DNA-binding NarL/FixJ family response regulator